MNRLRVWVVTLHCSAILASVSFSAEMLGGIEQAKAGASTNFYAAATGPSPRALLPANRNLVPGSQAPQSQTTTPEDDQSFLLRVVNFTISHREFPYTNDKQLEDQGTIPTEPENIAVQFAKYIKKYYENGKLPIYSNMFAVQKKDGKQYAHFVHIGRNAPSVIIIGNMLMVRDANGDLVGPANVYLLVDGIQVHASARTVVMDAQTNLPEYDADGKAIMKFSDIDFSGYADELAAWKKHLERHPTPAVARDITPTTPATPTFASTDH